MIQKQKDLIIGVSGVSGIGKTTLLRNIKQLHSLENYEIKVWLPKFVTTRPSRLSDEDGEIYCISREEFSRLEKNNGLIVSFQAHGHEYGLCQEGLNCDNNKLHDKRIIFVQVVHPDIGGLLKEKLAKTHDVKICMLIASPEKVYTRLKERNDRLPINELFDRQKMVLKPIPDYVDHIINAEQTPKEVAQDVIEIIKTSCLPIVSGKRLMITDKEKEVIQKVIEIGKQKSIIVCAFGGLAANIYGADRAITDIDLLTDCKDFSWLIKNLEFEDIDLSEEIITIGRVDLRKCPIKIGDSDKEQFWKFDNEARKKLKTINLDGMVIDVLSIEDKIVMKATLQRDDTQGKFDILDLKQMLANCDSLDKSYISYRAQKCNSLEKVTECLAKHGLHI